MSPQELQVQKKRELEGIDESTTPARTFVPTADIYEDRDSLKVILEMPGVEKGNVEVKVEEGVLFVEGRLDLAKYRGRQPVYTEYNIGNYSRSFRLSNARSGQDRRRTEGWRAVIDACQGREGQAADHSGVLIEQPS